MGNRVILSLISTHNNELSFLRIIHFLRAVSARTRWLFTVLFE